MTASESRTTRAKAPIIISLAVIVVGIGIAMALLIGGILPLQTTSHPPCEELPSVAAVKSALDSRTELAGELAAQGEAIQVTVDTPCAEDTTAALIKISYQTAEERTAIEGVLNQRDGFGVPVIVVKQ